MKTQKIFAVIIIFMVLLIGIATINATNIDNNTQVDSSISDDSSYAVDMSSVSKNSKTIKSNVKTVKDNRNTNINLNKKNDNVKSLKTDDSISVTNDNFNDYFTSSGCTDKINDGSTINFETNISRSESILINKKVTINGNGYAFTLNSKSSGYDGSNTGNSLSFEKGSDFSKVSNIHFTNTQIYVRNSTGIIFDNNTHIVANQSMGGGVGTFSIRDYSSNVTVNNSNFYTEENGGSSTLVLAVASNCTINNCTFRGVGFIGNIIYLTTYNTIADLNDPFANTGNRITNNKIYKLDAPYGTCYGIAVSGHSNIIQNNTIMYSGNGIVVQYGYREVNTPENCTGKYRGNYYINNTLLNGATFLSTKNSTVIGNILSGTTDFRENATVYNNLINGTVVILNNTKVANNTFNNSVSVTKSDVLLENNTFNNLTISNNLENITLNNNVFYGKLSSGSEYYSTNNKNGTLLTLEVEDSILIGSDAVINVTLTDGLKKAIPNSQIVLNIGSFTTTLTTNEQGRATYTYQTSQRAFNVIVKATYDGNDNYANSSDTKKFNIVKFTTSITITDPMFVVTRGDNVTINGTLFDKNSNAIPNTELIMTVKRVNYTIQTDDEGKYSYTFTPYSTGTWTIKVTFNGNDQYYQSSAETFFDVEVLGTQINIDDIDDMLVNETFDITGNVAEWFNNKPVTEGTVEVTVGGVNKVFTTNLDENGTFKVTVTAPTTVNTYTVKAEYQPTQKYAKDSTETTYRVIKSSVTINAEHINVKYKENSTIKATLTDRKGNPINGGKVVFKLNSITIRDENGNPLYGQVVDGVAKITTSLPYNPRDYVLTVVFSGNTLYDSKRINSTLTITKRTANITLSTPTTFKMGNKITLKATITDGDSLVNGGKVIFKLNGIALRDNDGNVIYANVADGIVQTEYEISQAFSSKTYNLTAIYSNSVYERAETSANLTTVKSDTIIDLNPIIINRGENATISGKIVDDNGNNVVGNSIVAIKVNGITLLKTKITNGILNVKIPTSELKNNKYNVTVVVGENKAYYSSRLTQIITIND